MNTDLQRAAEALRLGRLDEATLHAWNALMTIGPEDVGELRQIAAAIGSSSLQRELDARWGGVTAPPPVPVPVPVRPGRRRLQIALVILIIGVTTRAWGLPTESGVRPATARAFSATSAVTPKRITGDGIWLVPLGQVDTIDLGRLAFDLSSEYYAWAGPVQVVTLPSSTVYPTREQLSAEALIDLLNKHYIASGRTTVVGITDYDMRSNYAPSTFSLRAQVHYGVVSTARLGANLGDRLQGHNRYERVRKLVKRQVEFHRNGGVQSSDPRSLLRPPLTRVGEIDQLDEDL